VNGRKFSGLPSVTTGDNEKLQTKQPADESVQDLSSSHKKNYILRTIFLHPSRSSGSAVTIIKCCLLITLNN
jgi:hypothetical protein